MKYLLILLPFMWGCHTSKAQRSIQEWGVAHRWIYDFNHPLKGTDPLKDMGEMKKAANDCIIKTMDTSFYKKIKTPMGDSSYLYCLNYPEFQIIVIQRNPMIYVRGHATIDVNIKSRSGYLLLTTDRSDKIPYAQEVRYDLLKKITALL